MYGGRGRGAPIIRMQSRIGVGAAAPGAEPNRGFVISIAGYSPYKEIGELLDPTGAGDDMQKWGVATRLMHLNKLDKLADGNDVNSPFELYGKTDKRHFEVQTGEVDVTAEMPPGIGQRKTGDGGQMVLVDPMTRETISREAAVDESGRKLTDTQGSSQQKGNDRWFVMNFKLRWKEAPVPAANLGAPGAGATTSGSAAQPAASGGRSKSPTGGGEF